jgi:hypothetical protein
MLMSTEVILKWWEMTLESQCISHEMRDERTVEVLDKCGIFGVVDGIDNPLCDGCLLAQVEY